MKLLFLKTLVFTSVLIIFSPFVLAGYSTELLVGGGYHECLKDDEMKCTYVDPSIGLFFAPGFKINKHIGINLDINLGFFDLENTNSDDTYYSLQIIPVIRGYLPLNNKLQIFGGAGVGYSKLDLSGSYIWPVTNEYINNIDYEYTWYNFLSLKLNGGAYYKLRVNRNWCGQIL